MKTYVCITMQNDDSLDFICTYPNDSEWLDDLNNPRKTWIKIGAYIVQASNIKYIEIKEVKE